MRCGRALLDFGDGFAQFLMASFCDVRKTVLKIKTIVDVCW